MVRELTLTQREHIAENLKERIYSTITLIAVMASLWQTAQHHSARGAAASIVGAVVALWLATLIAARMSHRAVHGKSVSRQDYRKVAFTASGLLAPAILPTLLVLFSMTELISLKTSLMIGMVILLLSLFILSFTAGLKIYDNKWRLLLVSTLEMSVGIGVILLKLALGE